MTKKGRGNASTKHRAFSIPAAARRLEPLITEGMLRRAVSRGQVRTVPFGGLDRITDAEIERIRGLFEASGEAAE